MKIVNNFLKSFDRTMKVKIGNNCSETRPLA